MERTCQSSHRENYCAALAADSICACLCVFSFWHFCKTCPVSTSQRLMLTRRRGSWEWPRCCALFFQYVPCLVSGIHSSLSLGLWDFFDIKIDTRGRTQRAPLFLRERRACALLILRSKPTSGTALHIQALIKERICAWMTSSKVPGGCGKGPFSGRGLALAVPASENGLMDQDKSSSEKGDGGRQGVDCRSDCKELWWVR